MSWVTPKTNWQSGDYYNIEDVDRITGNLAVVKSLASEVFATREIALVAWYDTYPYYPGSYLAEAMFLSVPDITIYTTEDYLSGTEVMTRYESENMASLLKLKTLYMIYELGEFSIPQINVSEKLIIDQTSIHQGGSPTYYSGNGYYMGIDYRYFFSRKSPEMTAFSDVFFISDPYDPTKRLNHSYYSLSRKPRYYYPYEELYDISYNSLLGNTSFWSSYELNIIEKQILKLYTDYSNVIEG